jgi:hypothetical protein
VRLGDVVAEVFAGLCGLNPVDGAVRIGDDRVSGGVTPDLDDVRQRLLADFVGDRGDRGESGEGMVNARNLFEQFDGETFKGVDARDDATGVGGDLVNSQVPATATLQDDGDGQVPGDDGRQLQGVAFLDAPRPSGVFRLIGHGGFLSCEHGAGGRG